MDAIIPSLMDTDYYQINMGQFAFFNFPDIDVRYRSVFRCKTAFPDGFAGRLRHQVELMSSLRATAEEIDFLREKGGHYLKPNYLEWLSGYQFNPDEVEIRQAGGQLDIEITGPWYRTIFWETPVLSLISEMYHFEMDHEPIGNWIAKAAQKAKRLQEGQAFWAEFGSRRRHSLRVHEEVLKAALPYQAIDGKAGLVGTSNVMLAMKYGLTPIGTMAHQVFSVLGAVYGYRAVNKLVLETWANEFGGHLGIVLPDTFTTDFFLRDFTRQHATRFDGGRQDSGDPYLFADKWIGHYDKHSIDPASKTIIFSDGLNVDKILAINPYRADEIVRSFGYGTGFTNDVGHDPLKSVIKAFAARRPGHPWHYAVKIPDEPGKETGYPEEITVVKQILQIAQ